MGILGIDIGGTSIKAGKTDDEGNMEIFREFESDGRQGADRLMKRLFRIIAEFDDFEKIGISTAGQVNHTDGSILFANNNIPGYTGVELKSIIENQFQRPVKVENDVNAAALGEKFFGAGKLYRDYLCLTYGTGIGGSIIMNSKVYRGNNGSAGEFGHILTHPSGLLCNCGGRGCYEMYASTSALIKRAMEIDNSLDNGRMILASYNEGNSRLKKAIKDWTDEIAYGIVSLIHIFNPPLIILGGGIMEQDLVVKLVSEKVQQMIMDSYKDVKIVKASLGNKAGVLGAVSLFLEQVEGRVADGKN